MSHCHHRRRVVVRVDDVWLSKPAEPIADEQACCAELVGDASPAGTEDGGDVTLALELEGQVADVQHRPGW
jgi:hypothetical protein